MGLVGHVRRLSGYEPVRFVAVGAVNSLFAYLVFAGLHTALGERVHYTVVLVIATVVGILEAYVLQRWLTFRATGHWWKDLARFSTVYAVAFVVNLGTLPLLVEVVRSARARRAGGHHGGHRGRHLRRAQGVQLPPHLTPHGPGSAGPTAPAG